MRSHDRQKGGNNAQCARCHHYAVCDFGNGLFDEGLNEFQRGIANLGEFIRRVGTRRVCISSKWKKSRRYQERAGKQKWFESQRFDRPFRQPNTFWSKHLEDRGGKELNKNEMSNLTQRKLFRFWEDRNEQMDRRQVLCLVFRVRQIKQNSLKDLFDLRSSNLIFSWLDKLNELVKLREWGNKTKDTIFSADSWRLKHESMHYHLQQRKSRTCSMSAIVFWFWEEHASSNCLIVGASISNKWSRERNESEQN